MWVLVFGGIALAGLVMLISYGVWLAHKAADVMGEMGVLADRAGQLVDLLAQIEIAGARARPAAGQQPPHGRGTDPGAIRDVG